jgi:hypothetical protein
MSDSPCSFLPDHASWCFHKIAEGNPGRAAQLKQAGSPSALLKALKQALDLALQNKDFRIGHEHAADERGGYRAVVQFHVGDALFDWFFNARTGYRAHFRAHYQYGLGFNCEIVEALRKCLDQCLPDVVGVRELNSGFGDCGESELAKSVLSNSLAAGSSKISYCSILIGCGGEPKQLPLGVGGAKILLENGDEWTAYDRCDADAWLELKGAFLGDDGYYYQVKDPIFRAIELQKHGTL